MNTNVPAANRDVTSRDNRTTTSEKIDYAGIETGRLQDEYRGIEATLERLEVEEAAILAVPDDETGDQVALTLGGIVKRARDLRHETENTRIVEVEPNFRRYQAGNAYFNGLKEKLQPEDKTQRRRAPGVMDRAQAKIDAHQDRKEARERARLEEQERQARLAREAAEREEARKREEAAQAERNRIEAEQRAARARTEETRAAREAEAKTARVAEQKLAAEAAAAAVVVEQKQEQHTDARISTLGTSADMVRTRGTTPEGGGVLLTKGTEKIAELEDRTLLTDAAKLLLFEQATDAMVQAMVSKYANATGHRSPLPGCIIEIRRKGITK